MGVRIVALIIGFGMVLGVFGGAAAAESVYHNPAVPGPGDALYWLDQGGLLATYGNYTAAVKAYSKAIELDPQQGEAYFDLGVALAEMGKLSEGLTQIEKAISLNPQNARYLYGRGRVHLLSGDRERAFGDFNKAAAMGNADAIAHLSR